MTLRDHMKAYHPKAQPRRSNADLAAEHARQHHRYTFALDHHHGGSRGADDRPPGWYTGADVVMTRERVVR